MAMLVPDEIDGPLLRKVGRRHCVQEVLSPSSLQSLNTVRSLVEVLHYRQAVWLVTFILHSETYDS